MPLLNPYNRPRFNRYFSAAGMEFARQTARSAAKALTTTRSKKYLRGSRKVVSNVHPPKGRVHVGLMKRGSVDQRGTPLFNDLLFMELSAIPRGTDLNTRERDQIVMSGIRLRLEFRATAAAANMLHLCWALVQFKQKTPGALVTKADLNSDFFRGTLTSRNVAFDATAMGNHKLTYPINADKYVVIARGDIPHSATATTTSGGTFGPYVSYDRYIRVNKSIEYDTNTSDSAHNPLVFVYWFMHGDLNQTTTIPTIHSGTASAIYYFRDVV